MRNSFEGKYSFQGQGFLLNESHGATRINDRRIEKSFEAAVQRPPASEEEAKLKAAFPFIVELDTFVKKTQGERLYLRKELGKAVKLLTKMSQEEDGTNSEFGSIGKRLETLEATVG